MSPKPTTLKSLRARIQRLEDSKPLTPQSQRTLALLKEFEASLTTLDNLGPEEWEVWSGPRLMTVTTSKQDALRIADLKPGRSIRGIRAIVERA